MNTKIRIRTKTLNQKLAAVAFLYALGYNYCGSNYKDLLQVGSDLMDYEYQDIIVDKGDYESMDFLCNDYGDDGGDAGTILWWDKMGAITDFLTETHSMKLTGDYDAVVTKDGIRVGCQLITFAKFKELSNLVDKVSKS